MSKIKKLIALTLALAMVLSVSAFAGSYSKTTYADADKINTDCEEAVELLYALDIMVGDGKNFNPESAVTRAEMAKMIYVILNYGDDDKAYTYTGAKFFTDVEAGYWAEGYINYCAATKLIAGRGDGTFDPTAPVTCAEAAKMLLTAIGYSAEHRGYTGANWDKNVLADAAIIGLLNGYKYNTNLVAPRQWVAVMIENMLVDAYTFGNMAPNFSGLLVSGVNVNGNGSIENAYETMGEKYYGFEVIEGVMTATYEASVHPTYDEAGNHTGWKYASKDGRVIIDGVQLKGTGLGYMDLGETFKVIYVEDTENVVLSIRNTGEAAVGYAEKQDITYDIDYKTSSNDAANKYVFTVGDLEAKFSTSNEWLEVSYAGNKSYHGQYATILKGEAGDLEADLIKAVAYDGVIEYVIEVQYTYGAVDGVVSSTYYGDYFTVENVQGTALKPTATTSRWYLDDVVNTEDEIEEGNYLKINFNPDNGKYDVEVLPVAEEVTYDDRIRDNGIITYVLGGVDYVIAANGFEPIDKNLEKAEFEDVMDVVYDGDLLVYTGECKAYNTLEEANAQMGLIIATSTGKYDNGFWHDRNGIKYMDINGDVHTVEYVADNGKDAYIPWTNICNEVGSDVDCTKTGTAKLYIIHSDGEKAWAEYITIPALDVAAATLNDYAVLKTGKLDTLNDRYVIGTGVQKVTYTIESENLFWTGIKNSDGEWDYAVKTLAELADGYDTAVRFQALMNGSSVKNIRAGYVKINDLRVDQETDYLYTVSALSEATSKCDVMFPGAEATEYIKVKMDNGVEYKSNTLYKYSYDAMSDVYTLKAVPADWYSSVVDYDYTTNTDGTAHEIKNFIDSCLVLNKDGDDATAENRREYTIDELEVLVITNTVELKANKDEGATDTYYAIVDTTLEFVTAEQLAEKTIVNGEFADGVFYYSDLQYKNSDDLVIITLYNVQDEANID